MENRDKIVRVKHMCNLGDIIAIMPALKTLYEKTKQKIVLCQQLNVEAQYYPGAIHPTVDDAGSQVCLNNSMYEMVKPLIVSQDYIHDMEKYEGQEINLDFDTIRGKTFVGMPNLMIQSWVMYAFPDLAYDLSKPWIHLLDTGDDQIKKQVEGKVIVNFTQRYRNNVTDYFFLKKYSDSLVFAGTEKEHFLFCHKWQLDIPRLEVSNFLEMAYALKYCKFFIGCQSFLWNLAQAMHIPRIVELCSYAPNVQPFIGEKSYGFYHQVGVEYYFNLLY